MKSPSSPLQSPRRAEGDGLEEVVKVLLQQQATLQGLVQMNGELRTLVKTSVAGLERKITGMQSPWVAEHQSDAQEDTTIPKEEPYSSEQGRPRVDTKASNKDMMKLTGPTTPSASNLKKNSKDKRGLRSSIRGETWDQKSSREKVKIVLSHPIWDVIMGVLIALNFITIFAELEWKGKDLGLQLQIRTDNNGWDQAKVFFKVIEKGFNVVFVLDLLLHLYAWKCRCPTDTMQLLDMFAITLSAVDSFIFDPLFDGNSTKAFTLLRLVRVLRALRLLRFLRVLRFMGMFSALRVLVQTIKKSVGSLFWSMAIVSFIVLATAMFMATLMQDVIMDTDLDYNLRRWAYSYYGGAFQAAYTMFEATFSAKWATHLSANLIQGVNPWFSVFWIFYTVVVNFAVIRVISALFLKQTLDIAAIDAERVAAAKLKQQEKTLDTLRTCFKMADQLGDGVLHKWEFEEMMNNPEILEKFETLELEHHELFTLFDILSEDDGMADQEEFLAGAMKLKTQVKTVDIIHIMQQQLVLKRYIMLVADGLNKVDSVLHPKNPWQANYADHLKSQTVTSPINPAIGGPTVDDDKNQPVAMGPGDAIHGMGVGGSLEEGLNASSNDLARSQGVEDELLGPSAPSAPGAHRPLPLTTRLLRRAMFAALAGACLAAVGAGTMATLQPHGPQLRERHHLHRQDLDIVGLAGVAAGSRAPEKLLVSGLCSRTDCANGPYVRKGILKNGRAWYAGGNKANHCIEKWIFYDPDPRRDGTIPAQWVIYGTQRAPWEKGPEKKVPQWDGKEYKLDPEEDYRRTAYFETASTAISPPHHETWKVSCVHGEWTEAEVTVIDSSEA